ncbi:hypothetical protein MLD38_024000 [Melastoma candidum]|uniref:Uncharacterized protein n=1 Tax=Melastoma candidum TaxID=119954 RepID=A0ACB9NSN3_9MYRT|nr:hypothetical protein MLD38_024000 [Melastoma candidum]
MSAGTDAGVALDNVGAEADSVGRLLWLKVALTYSKAVVVVMGELVRRCLWAAGEYVTANSGDASEEELRSL